ncbi:MAG: DUF4058 family protein [Isosphaeraceae bacterium]
MPAHDWTRVDSGIFHDFHLEWISQIKRALNAGLLPPDYYALAEQQVGRLEPDVLTLRGLSTAPEPPRAPTPDDGGDGGGGATDTPSVGLKHAPPRVRLRCETPADFATRKSRAVVVRHVSGDGVVAMIEIVSPGNKDSRRALKAFVEKALWLLDQRVHLLILDLVPPSPRDPRGIHAARWEEAASQDFNPPEGKPLTLVSYEADLAWRAYVEPLAVGDPLPDMPLFLKPQWYVDVPLEQTYQNAFDAVPLRWRNVVARVD